MQVAAAVGVSTFGPDGSLALCAWNAAAMAMAPLRPVPATRHTTVLKASGLTGVKYGPSNLNGVSTPWLVAGSGDPVEVVERLKCVTTLFLPGFASVISSSTKDASRFVHCVLFSKGGCDGTCRALLGTLCLNRNCMLMESSPSFTTVFCDARCVMVVKG
jgi:hypothetical protein